MKFMEWKSILSTNRQVAHGAAERLRAMLMEVEFSQAMLLRDNLNLLNYGNQFEKVDSRFFDVFFFNQINGLK